MYYCKFDVNLYSKGDSLTQRCCSNFMKDLSNTDWTMYQVLESDHVTSSAVTCVDTCRQTRSCVKISFRHSNHKCVLLTTKTSEAVIPTEYIDDVEIYTLV